MTFTSVPIPLYHFCPFRSVLIAHYKTHRLSTYTSGDYCSSTRSPSCFVLKCIMGYSVLIKWSYSQLMVTHFGKEYDSMTDATIYCKVLRYISTV